MIGVGDPSEKGLFQGLVTGVVADNSDPEGLGRIPVRLPWQDGGETGSWARMRCRWPARTAAPISCPRVEAGPPNAIATGLPTVLIG